MRTAIAIAALLALTGCRKDAEVVPPQGTLRVTFRPTWNGDDFDKTNVYLTAANERVLIQQVKFYLSPIELRGDTDAYASQAVLLDLTDGPVERRMDVRAGAYDSLYFGLGVPYALNHRDITTVIPPDPLDFSQGMYWTWTTMYRFMIFDGRYDTDPGATGTPPFSFSLHTGLDACYRTRSVAVPLGIRVGGTTAITLDVDIARFFTNGTEVLDLSEGSQSHGESQSLPQAMRLSDLAVQAIGTE